MKKIIDAEELIKAIRDDPYINGKNFARVKLIVESMPDARKDEDDGK